MKNIALVFILHVCTRLFAGGVWGPDALELEFIDDPMVPFKVYQSNSGLYIDGKNLEIYHPFGVKLLSTNCGCEIVEFYEFSPRSVTKGRKSPGGAPGPSVSVVIKNADGRIPKTAEGIRLRYLQSQIITALEPQELFIDVKNRPDAQYTFFNQNCYEDMMGATKGQFVGAGNGPLIGDLKNIPYWGERTFIPLFDEMDKETLDIGHKYADGDPVQSIIDDKLKGKMSPKDASRICKIRKFILNICKLKIPKYH